jgi:non-ribosomal peptide synthetase component E (peptide arylation enzyme)
MKSYESITVGQILEKGADQVPDKFALVDGNQRKTYKELNDMAKALSASLAKIGFRKGMDDFPKLSGGVKIKKFGQCGLAELAQKDECREQIHK